MAYIYHEGYCENLVGRHSNVTCNVTFTDQQFITLHGRFQPPQSKMMFESEDNAHNRKLLALKFGRYSWVNVTPKGRKFATIDTWVRKVPAKEAA